MGVEEMHMLWWKCENSLRDRVWNEDSENWKKVGVVGIKDRIRENRLRWFEHMQRCLGDALFIKVKSWDFGDFRRGREWPKMTWMEGVKKDMSILGLEEHLTLDQGEWSKKVWVDVSNWLYHMGLRFDYCCHICLVLSWLSSFGLQNPNGLDFGFPWATFLNCSFIL